MVLEGVHLVPGMMPTEIEGALVVHAILAIESEEVHRTHFHVRDELDGRRARDGQVPRPAERDQRRFRTTWSSGPTSTGIPVIESSNIERATTAVLELVLASADRVEVLV